MVMGRGRGVDGMNGRSRSTFGLQPFAYLYIELSALIVVATV